MIPLCRYAGSTVLANYTSLVLLRSSNGQPLAFSFVDYGTSCTTVPFAAHCFADVPLPLNLQYLQIRWCCPLIDKDIPASTGTCANTGCGCVPGWCSRAEWQRLACELDLLYSQFGGIANVSDLMHEMAQLLPFSSSAVFSVFCDCRY